jgi:AcrR family transcriptional regulator
MNGEVRAPQLGRPRNERIDQAVLAATIELLDSVGYSGITIETVAEKAGTSRPSIYRRWPSLQYLIMDTLAVTLGTEPTPDTGCTHCDLIIGIGTLTEAFTTTNLGRVLASLVADLRNDPQLSESFLERLFRPRRETSAEAIRRGIARGDIRPDVDIELLLDMIAATTYYRALFRHLPITEELAENAVLVVLGGVATEQWRSLHRGHAS